MKVRNGFVSNSSSSSYIISIKENLCEKCTNDNKMLLDFFIDNLKRLHKEHTDESNIGTYSGDVKHYLECLEQENKEIDKDLVWIEKELFILGELSQNKDAVELFGRWDQIKEHRTSLRCKRFSNESKRKYKINENELKNHMEYCASEMKRKTEYKEILQAKIEKLSNALDEDELIFVFELDNMDPNIRNVNKLLNSDWINVIEREST